MLAQSSTFLETPPHALEAERTVLGALLLDPEAIIKVSDFLRPEDFYDPRLRSICQVMYELYQRHEPIDFVTVASRLSDSGILNDVGGSAFLAELASLVPTSSHIYQYGQIVKEKAVHRSVIDAGRKIVGFGYDLDLPVAELLDSVERTVFSVTNTVLKEKFVHIRDILDARYERFAELHEADDPDAVKGTTTGFHSLDAKLSGFQPSDLIVLAARPSMGKTSLALNIAQNAAIRFQKTVGIFSLEMSKEQLVDRLFASMLGVDSWKLQRGKLDDTDFQNMGPIMDELNKANIFIDDSVASSLTELRTKARRLQMEHGLDLLVVDYIQLMTTGNVSYAGNRVQEISEISRCLKQLARELRIPVLALSQLSRAVESRPGNIPQLSDLRESGAIEQDADVVLMMYREDYYDEESGRPGMTDVYIRKHRNGPTGRVELLFKKEQMRFYDVDKVHTSQ
ncbi:replicative DNA helicase [Candidatus Peribacteria bacterium RIFCSPLOWO2_12_FULL_55_15]|nr:MAG: replicative DNA helicase [Candidatus Peribacteria bacterium RIFCSPHIGHO2_01_FULL_54_22]OGJ62543.1 MAG: replicative DNA helicase [Candidatus Peribacteria bacterium RIFCSPHIGHO2_02_FULL_55_24]OGJ63663.1 MAG: replicative DNA helicase [Candidatus Peribacteria bacterium RIFCSPHIGHO2_12_FULL_54_10]OGJ68574.1 MAG: replicative DNA helicase [Candidatus Peribacteria bacterium RIFCSPLOWO2_01_FULL_54_110]OGJ69690.1 MAG: replicative DNA helicase [Candidatus Peribacteria bacterium RIFCSPLOWO2_02_FULL